MLRPIKIEPEDLDIIQVTVPGKGQTSEGLTLLLHLNLQESNNSYSIAHGSPSVAPLRPPLARLGCPVSEAVSWPRRGLQTIVFLV